MVCDMRPPPIFTYYEYNPHFYLSDIRCQFEKAWLNFTETVFDKPIVNHTIVIQ